MKKWSINREKMPPWLMYDYRGVHKPFPNTQQVYVLQFYFGFTFRPVRGRDDCSGFLHLWVGNTETLPCVVPTTYDVGHQEWCAVSGLMIDGAPTGRQAVLSEYNEMMAQDLRLMESVLLKMETIRRDFTPADVMRAWMREKMK